MVFKSISKKQKRFLALWSGNSNVILPELQSKKSLCKETRAVPYGTGQKLDPALRPALAR